VVVLWNRLSAVRARTARRRTRRDLIVHRGLYTAAYILGFISPIAPAGLGVREFTLAAFMVQLGLANEADAALVAIAARLWLTIVELVPSGLYIAAGPNRTSSPT